MLKSRLLGAVGIVALVVGVLMAQTPAKPLAFEVASVKPNQSGNQMPSLGALPGGHFTAVNQSLFDLISFAYSMEIYQIVQGPDWIKSSGYNIDATIGSSQLDPNGRAALSDLRGMIRTLLEDRFKLAARTERRELPVFALVMARSDRRLGAQLRTSGANCAPLTAPQGRSLPPPPPPPPPRPDSSAPPPPPDFSDPHGPTRCGALFLRGYITARAMTMGQLAVALSGTVHQPVVDRTMLDGFFDIDIDFAPGMADVALPAAANFDPNVPSVFTAVQEQLGLKLESTKAPADVLVIDHVEHPTED